MKKRLLSLGLAAAMAASLTACGGSSTTETTAAAAADTQAAQDSETAENAGEGGVLKIGVIGPLTGDAANYGVAVANGSQLAAEEINAAGGINGMTIEINAQDDELDPQKSVNAYNTLKDWGAKMIVGSVTSDACIAVSAETEADNMFQITPSGSAVECIAPANAFRICFADPDQGTASAQYIGENGLASKIAIIYDSSSSYSSGIREAFITEAENQGLEIVSDEAFTADTNTDFSVQLDKAKNAGAELVFLPIYYQQASVILKQASDKEFAPIFFGCDGMDGILDIENFDTTLAEGLMFLTPFVATEESSAAFTAAYTEEFGITPNQFAADAYDAVYAIKAAAEKSGITADMEISDICDGMKSAMLEVSIDGLTGEMSWNEDGEPLKQPKAAKIVDGEYVMQ